MSLTGEWADRVQKWRKHLQELFYAPLGEVELEGFVTAEQLSLEEAVQGDFQPMPPGTRWGSQNDYGWFRTTVTLPPEAEGKRIVFHTGMENECLLFVNGKAAGSRSRPRPELTLTREGEPGKTFDIVIEAYRDHGLRKSHAPFVPHGTDSIPPDFLPDWPIQKSTYGVWREPVFQAWLDFETLVQIRHNIDPESLRVMKIDEAVKKFTTIVDWELPPEQFEQTCREGSELLKPLLECANGSTAPEFFAFGHGHLDTAWLWPIEESERKAARTLSNQLSLAEEYPGYCFLMSQPAQYVWLEEKYPELYERVKQAVADGKIIADGAMWVEADTNVSGGEALIRQFIHGKKYFREKFGVESEMLWLPDVFGYTGALPQIMDGCGVKYFSTQKIFWNYHGGEPFPYNTFRWEGIDGSQVLVHLHNNYNAMTKPEEVIGRWKNRRQKEGFSTFLFPFGHGDGGGGPTRIHAEYMKRLGDCEGVPRMRYGTPQEFFEDLQQRRETEERYVGELYFQAHRGVQTSQAKTKRGNRKSEIALREAEMWCVAAAAGGKFTVPAEQLEEAWKLVLVNQFHDILPGSSIAMVYERAEREYTRVLGMADETIADAAGSLTDEGDAITVLNSLNWDRRELVALPDGWTGAKDAEGDLLCVQEVDGVNYVQPTVPSCGWTSLTPDKPRDICESGIACGVKATPNSLENTELKVLFDEFGQVTSIFDKNAKRELADGPCNSLKMYRDVPMKYDAWDIDPMYRDMPVELPEKANIEVATEGNLLGRLKITRKIHNSSVTQWVTLRRESRRLDFETTVDWQEQHKLLKVNFPVDIRSHEAIHEIQFGHLRRPNHESRQLDKDMFEVPNHKWTALAEENRGCAVINDCKYGVDVRDNSINLTLLKSPQAPAMNADRGMQKFTYSFYAWNGPLMSSDLIRQGYNLNVPIRTAAGAAETKSLLQTDADNIVIEAVKPAEDGSGDVIVRLYESLRSACDCSLTINLPVESVDETDMLEEKVSQRLTLANGGVQLSFRPFEIKTLRLRNR
ncbi:MAG: glycoside hydrolase family 38 C-terminal domain-containing protein [Phycisphaerae bacterium]